MIADESSSTSELETIAVYILSSDPTAVLVRASHLCLIGSKSEAQRDDVTCLESHSEMLSHSLNPSLKTPNSELALFLFLFLFLII